MNPNPEPVRPWWKEPYVWMVIAGPASAVLACVVTAVYIFQGPDRLVAEDQLSQSRAMQQEIRQADTQRQPALVGRNHSATGGARHEQP
jgi:hypothetical protein